jgi:LysR family transcriptional regulator, hydrogen peroxide-inducible genes activator
MAAAGAGYAFMPVGSVVHEQVVVKPLVDPEIWREVSLVTVRGRPHSPVVGALIREAMRSPWADKRALAVRFERQPRGRGANARSPRDDASRSS